MHIKITSMLLLVFTSICFAQNGQALEINHADKFDWVGILKTLAATFVGAMLAFLSQLYWQRKNERKAALMSAHRMLFCLLQQISTIVLIQRDFVFPNINDPARFISIPAVQEFDIKKDVFDFSTFAFMLESSESRKIMYDLYLAQENYVEALRSLNERSKVHRQDMQPILAASRIKNGGFATAEEVGEILGPLVLSILVNSTESTLLALKRAFAKLVKSKKDFRAYAVKRFKTKDFTDFDYQEDYGLTDD